MKKLYFIVLLICSINAVGQRYKFTFGWDPYQIVGESYTLKVGNKQIDRYNQKHNGMMYEFIDYELQLNATDHLRFELDAITQACAFIPNQFFDFSIQEIMSGLRTYLDGCYGSGEIINFKPSEIALNSIMTTEYPLGNPAHYTICSGDQLEIFATIPNKSPIVDAENYYPPAAFHWQYSTDNKQTWVDVPEYILKNGVSTKNTSYNNPKLSISMDEILGQNHKEYYNKIIFFQLGCNIRTALYDPDRGYYWQGNTSYASLNNGVLYLPCTPVIDGDIVLETPDCNYQEIKEIKIPFDRDLEDKEELRDMSLYNDITPGTPVKTINTSITYNNKTFYFPVDDVTLISKANYQIKYVSYKNDKPRALEISNFFAYNTPPAVTFKVTANNPKCHDGKVDITIEADGGTPPYYYDHLNGETEIVNGISQVKRIRFDTSDKNKKNVTIQHAELKEYNIRITDDNNCIEKTL